MKKIVLLCVCILFMSACTSNTLKTTLDKDTMVSNRYELSDNYANHRLQQTLVPTSGGKLSVIDVGQGPVLVLIHGVPTSSWLFRKMIPDLQEDFRVIAIDLLGFGGSDKPEATLENYLPIAQANYVHQVLEALDVENYNLLFHDMGGLVAWEMLRKDISMSNNVRSLTILNTIISKKGFEYPKVKKGVLAKTMSEAYSSKLSSAAVLKLTFKNMGLSSNKQLSEKECFGYVAPMREGADSALYEFFTGFDDARFSRLESNIAALADFNGRSQILWGGQDKVLTVDQFPQLTKSLAVNVEDIKVYHNNSHFLPEEIPDELNRKIRGFILENDSK